MLNLTGKTAAVLGAGRSGRAAARLAEYCGARVTIYDSCEAEEAVLANPEIGLEVNADLVVVSPGIETNGDFVQSFAKGSGALWGEIELAWRCYSGKTIGITGTNGKTTTTELVRDLVEATGESCVACGNYGVPLSEVVLYDSPPSVISLELSSFQLETIIDFNPDVVIWLNFSPDHMDRYFSIDEYRDAKLRIFDNIDADTPVVVRSGSQVPERGRVTTFSTEDEADWSLSGDDILCFGEAFVSISETRLRGLHNAENLMAACAAVEGLTSEVAREALSKYSPPEHRCELVAVIDGVEYLNDSKATNLHALESALRSQTRPAILIAGGKQKGLDYRPLAPLLAQKVKAMISFGEIGEELSSVFTTTVQCRKVETLEEAVAMAVVMAERGETILFSPGTSSFDQFNGYEERGRAFKAALPQMTKPL
ncbi:UDP-N-acetylmuramoyl-L-alanine--D-glutamate ligase [bacterium]|nr:UDP-N-acetylmuramoyl-L-alanine--D-glutamate ligase [bacterium]